MTWRNLPPDLPDLSKPFHVNQSANKVATYLVLSLVVAGWCIAAVFGQQPPRLSANPVAQAMAHMAAFLLVAVCSLSALIHGLYLFLWRGPCLILSPKGLRARRPGDRIIPWNDIVRIRSRTYRTNWFGIMQFVEIHVSDRYLQQHPQRKYLTFGAPKCVFLHSAGLALDHAELYATVRDYYRAHRGERAFHENKSLLGFARIEESVVG
jgi:hypothetical protein